MRRIIITSLIALTALGGVASADRRDRNDGNRWRGHDNGGVRVERRNHQHRAYRNNRTYVRPYYRASYRPYVRIVRQPIYVQRPVIRYRYYDYAQRPTMVVENYPTKAGYLWVAGQWSWSGYEWTWQQGHYQPDPAYDQQYYNNDGQSYGPYSGQYDNGQYDNGQYYNGQYQQPYNSSVNGSIDLNVNGSYSF